MQASFHTVWNYMACQNTSTLACGNRSESLMFVSDFWASTECKTTFAVAPFNASSAQFCEPEWYSNFSKLSDSSVNIPVYLSGLCVMSVSHEKVKNQKQAQFFLKGWLIAWDEIPDVCSYCFEMTLTSRPVTSLGAQGGEELSERGANFLNYVQHIFPGGEKPPAPPSYGPADKSC